MQNINLEFNQKGGKSMKKMATEAMMSTNGGKKYFCTWCDKTLDTTWFKFLVHRAKKHWFA